jgi:NAD(P)H dehydrogenase (quinone)
MVARDLARLPDLPGAVRRGPASYHETGAMQTALAGADTLLLVSANLSPRRVAEHTSAIDAAVAVGVQRIIYVSLLGAAQRASYPPAQEHWETEQYLARTGLPCAILRAGFYMSMLPGLVDPDGTIRGPAGEGRVSLLAHEDLAEVATALLLRHDSNVSSAWLAGQVYEVTGPEAITLGDAARRLSRITGLEYSYQPEEPAEQVTGSGPEPEAAQVSWYRAIARGEVATVSGVVPLLTGHPARPLEAGCALDSS